MAFISPESLLPSGLSVDERGRVLACLQGTRIAIGRELDWSALFGVLEWPRSAALVCDNQTWKALGERLANSLSAQGYAITLLNLGSAPAPDESRVRYIIEHTVNCEGLIAVGSGTINDLTQYAAHQSHKPYVICGTAPSMNGYLSANAAILLHGHKKSLPAALPRAAFFDLDVMEAAPARLRQAGLGDSICRSTAQMDWLLSHYLLDTTYDSLPFALLAPYEEALLAGDSEALIRTLLLSGLGMTLAGGSYPASQAEHLLSHYMEMRFHAQVKGTLHGEQIAVTTLYVAALQDALFSRPNAPEWNAKLPDNDTLIAHFGTKTGAEVIREWQEKLQKIGEKDAFNARLLAKWDELRTIYAQIRVPTERIRAVLEHAGAPLAYETLGLSPENWQEAIAFAPFIRNRFTILDLALLNGR